VVLILQKQLINHSVIVYYGILLECECPETDSFEGRAGSRERPAPSANPPELLACEFTSRARRLLSMSERATILIAEDDADVLRAARIALAPHAARVETISTVDGLDQILAAGPFDVVLLDMNFVSGERSGGAGLNALARTQAFDPCLAVILMTAYGGVALAVEALKRGAVDFILKPWRNDKLIAAVAAAANITGSRREKETQHLEAVERNAIERALARHDGNISLAASELGLSRPALYRRMAKHGL
jgi:two-component system response regulator RegA